MNQTCSGLSGSSLKGTFEDVMQDALACFHPRLLSANSVDFADWNSLGEKASGLAMLTQNGFRVPRTVGFQLGGIRTWLESLPGYAGAIEDWAFWREANVTTDLPAELLRFRQTLLAAPPPPLWDTVAWRIGSHFQVTHGKGQRRWIARPSSGFIEEGETLARCPRLPSFFLDRLDAAALWVAIKDVLASMLTREGAVRVLRNGVDPRSFQPGVLLQDYSPPKLSGIVFTRDPAAPWGKKGRVDWASEGEAALRSCPEAPGAPFPEWNAFWGELWKQAERAEGLFEAPVELHWVWDGMQLGFVRVRVISSEEMELARRTPEGQVWIRRPLRRHFPEPLLPLDWDALQLLIRTSLENLNGRGGMRIEPDAPFSAQLFGFAYLNPGFEIRWEPGFRSRLAAIWSRVVSGGAEARSWTTLETVHAAVVPELDSLERYWEAHREKSQWIAREFRSRMDREREKAGEPMELLSRFEELRLIFLRWAEAVAHLHLIEQALKRALAPVWSGYGFPESGLEADPGWIREKLERKLEELTPLSPRRAQTLERCLSALEKLSRIREEIFDRLSELTQSWRLLVHLAGVKLLEANLLDRPEDAAFLRLRELQRALNDPWMDLRFMTARRRDAFQRTVTAPPVLPPA